MSEATHDAPLTAAISIPLNLVVQKTKSQDSREIQNDGDEGGGIMRVDVEVPKELKTSVSEVKENQLESRTENKTHGTASDENRHGFGSIIGHGMGC